jgi:hypothetical protein
VSSRQRRLSRLLGPWANAVETFFASLTGRRLQRRAFPSLVDPQTAINRYLGEYNRKPKLFVGTADPNRIIEKLSRGYWRIGGRLPFDVEAWLMEQPRVANAVGSELRIVSLLRRHCRALAEMLQAAVDPELG